MKDSLSIPITLSELGSHHMKTHLDIQISTIEGENCEILELEEERYQQMLRKE